MAAWTYKKKKRFAILHQRARKAIVDYLMQSTSVVKAPDIHAHVVKTTGLKVSIATIAHYLKEELNLQYKMIKTITFRHNAFDCLIAR